ncbi:MAG: flavodoxin [Actinobacteria bacterium]|nr:flavodoxin [Actinomycetota bacterium]
MRAVVVYESMFGDGQQIAESVTQGLTGAGLVVEAFEVGEAPERIDPDVALLVVGAPTHATALSRPATREDAAKKSDGHLVSSGIGVREWLKGLHAGDGSIRVAVWDTRARGPKAITSLDHAATTIRKRLGKLGFGELLGEEHFFVEDVRGPLVDGERKRALSWAEQLAALLRHP